MKGKKKKNKNPKLKNKNKANPIKKLDVNDEDFDFTESIKSKLFILANLNRKLKKAFLSYFEWRIYIKNFLFNLIVVFFSYNQILNTPDY